MLPTNSSPTGLLHVDGNDFIKADAAYQVVYRSTAKGSGETPKRCKIFLSDDAPICDEDVTSAEHYSFISSGNSKSTTGGFQLQENGKPSTVKKLIFETPTEDSSVVKVTRSIQLTKSILRLSSVEQKSDAIKTGKPYFFSLPAFGFIYDPSQYEHIAHLWLPSALVVFTFDNGQLQTNDIEISLPVKQTSFANYFTCTGKAVLYPKIPPTVTVNLSNIAKSGSRFFSNPLMIGGLVFAMVALLTSGCLLVQVSQGKALPKKRNQTRFLEQHYVAKLPRRKANGTTGSKSSDKSTKPTSTSTKRSKRAR